MNTDHCHLERHGHVLVVTLNRPEAKNALSPGMLAGMYRAWRQLDDDPELRVAVLTGKGDVFCAGADLKAAMTGDGNRLDPDGDGPMGPSRMLLSKPVIAAIEGHAVAGGLELAVLCDLRVAAEDAVLGVFCRRFGVPLIDGGTVRLPRLIGLSHALDLILTGRPVGADEAHRIGLVNRVAPKGQALAVALDLARSLSALPQRCMREDRLSAYESFGLSLEAALANEFRHGQASLAAPDLAEGLARFAAGAGRHGQRI